MFADLATVPNADRYSYDCPPFGGIFADSLSVFLLPNVPKTFHYTQIFSFRTVLLCFALLWEQLIANWTGGPTDRLSGCYGLPVKRVSAPGRAACDAPGRLHATQTRKFKSCAHTECSQIWNWGTYWRTNVRLVKLSVLSLPILYFVVTLYMYRKGPKNV